MWSDEQVQKASARKFESKTRKQGHYEAAQDYDLYDKVTNIPQIILGTILSTMTINQTTEEQYNYTISVVVSIMSISLTILTSICRFYDFQKRKSQHMRISLQYGNLERKIDIELIKEKQANFDIFLEVITNEYNQIRQDSPILPKGIDIDSFIP